MIRKGTVSPEALFAVTREEKSAQRLYALSEAAYAKGLAQGMALADARAVAPDLITHAAEPEKDEALLRALHRWADRFSPLVATEAPESLYLDITGCAHLFGGEHGLVQAIHDDLERLQLPAQLGLADTKRAAMAVARFGCETVKGAHGIIPPGEGLRVLGAFPVNALMADEASLNGLKRLGLFTIEAVAALPRAGLARRFGVGLVRRLDELLGAAPDPVSAHTAQPPLAARMTLPDPIGLRDDVDEALKRLARQVCRRLEERGEGARVLKLMVERVDHSVCEESIGLAFATRDPEIILRQFDPVLSKLDAGCGFIRLRLSVSVGEPLSESQGALGPKREGPSVLAGVLSRIGNRVGFDRVTQYEPAQSHLPERSFRRIPIMRDPKSVGHWPSPPSPRPIVQFTPEPLRVYEPGRPPREFSWRYDTYTLHTAYGPERLTPEWWRADPAWGGARDYWRVQTCEGARLWLFHALSTAEPSGDARAWHVAGIFP
ncbi:MAG: DNA polymerase Y family protein [Pseudomonadota bacterium]